MWFFIVLLISLAVFLSVYIPFSIVRKKYLNFVQNHSVALRRLKEINSKYIFKKIPNYDMEHSYDNENFYGDISCKDYLIYQLVYLQKKVSAALKDTVFNIDLYKQYKEEVEDTCIMKQFDTDDLLKNRKRLFKYEQKLFDKELLTPTLNFVIKVALELTNINGAHIRTKRDSFSAKEIKEIITKLNQRNGEFYLNEEIWHSICRVERGKVTNKMRFSIYKRDKYRCRKCGRKTNDLEIDHIIPIAKGGKSTYDNLQTLCHRCNVKKGDSLDF